MSAMSAHAEAEAEAVIDDPKTITRPKPRRRGWDESDRAKDACEIPHNLTRVSQDSTDA